MRLSIRKGACSAGNPLSLAGNRGPGAPITLSRRFLTQRPFRITLSRRFSHRGLSGSPYPGGFSHRAFQDHLIQEVLSQRPFRITLSRRFSHRGLSGSPYPGGFSHRGLSGSPYPGGFSHRGLSGSPYPGGFSSTEGFQDHLIQEVLTQRPFRITLSRRFSHRGLSGSPHPGGFSHRGLSGSPYPGGFSHRGLSGSPHPGGSHTESFQDHLIQEVVTQRPFRITLSRRFSHRVDLRLLF